MNILVVYDSVYGNTQQVAETIGSALSSDARVVKVNTIAAGEIGSVDLLVIGSPTLGGRATQPMQDFLEKLQQDAVKGVKVATFDTRYAGRFVKMFGFAADRMAESLTAKGGKLVAPPEAFIVTGKKGPLKEGELLHAASWARQISK